MNRLQESVLKLRATLFITVYSTKTGHYCLTLMQWIKYIIPTLCVSLWKRSRSISDQSAVIVWCDTSTETLGHWTEREQIIWIRTESTVLHPSSKGAGLSFHISALFFDIYEHKLSANELAFPSRPPSQHRHTHTLKHTVQYISSIWLVCRLERVHISTYQTVHFFNIYDIKASGMPISTISADWSYLGSDNSDDSCQTLIWNIKIILLIVVWPVRRVLSKSLTDVWVIQKLHDSHFSEELRKQNKERRFEKIVSNDKVLFTWSLW